MGGIIVLSMFFFRVCRVIFGGAGTVIWVVESFCLKRLSIEELLKVSV